MRVVRVFPTFTPTEGHAPGAFSQLLLRFCLKVVLDPLEGHGPSWLGLSVSLAQKHARR